MAIISRLYPCKECADHFKEILKWVLYQHIFVVDWMINYNAPWLLCRVNPVQAGSGIEFAQWMCKVHNIINRRFVYPLICKQYKSSFLHEVNKITDSDCLYSLQKPMFLCQRVDARWGALHCDNDACNLQGRMRHK